MIFRAEQCDLGEIKRVLRTTFPRVKSSHLSEAIAKGLDYRTSRSMQADFKASEPVDRTIREVAFAERLSELSGVKATGEPLTAALVQVIPAGLHGENGDERQIITVANLLFDERIHLHNSALEYLRGRGDGGADYQLPRNVDRPFSLSSLDLGDEDPDVTVEFCESDESTVIKSGEDDRTIAGLIDGDLDAIKRMLAKRKQQSG